MMKKFISIVLTICMLFSLITVTTAAEISENDRLALLKAKDYTFIDIKPNIDAFASADVVRDYAAYVAVDAADSASAFNELHTEDGYTYRTRIPSKTHGGIDIDGTESYYKKGMGYFKIDEERIYSSQKHSPLLFFTESFKLFADDIKNLELKKYAGVNDKTTAKMVAAAPETYAPETFNLADKDNGYNYMPLVEKIEKEGENDIVILKDNNSDAKFRIGPMNDKEFVKNAVDYAADGSGTYTVTLPAGVKGERIAIAATAANINNGGQVPEMLLSPAAALLPIKITYASGDVETKYMVITSLTNANDMVSSAIVCGEKYDNGREIDYKTEKEYYSQLQFMPKGSGLTFADVNFLENAENVSAGDLNFGFALRANQHDTGADFSNMINVGTFNLKDENISTITFLNDQKPGDNEIEGIISLKENHVRALVPVTVTDADPNKVYFLYVARVTQQSAVFGATVINKSLQEKIDAINAKLEGVNDETTEEECKAIYKEIQDLKAKSEYINDSDFLEEKYQIVKDVANGIFKEDIIRVTEKLNALKDVPYSAAMKAEIEALVADIKYIEEGTGEEFSPELKEVIERLVKQMNEDAFYVTQKLNYTRDIFEDLEAFKQQANTETGEYVFPAGAWQPNVTAVTGTTKFAVDEDAFVKKLDVDSNNSVTKNGIPYQFGPIKSAVHGKNNEPNSINAADSSSVIEIDVEQLPYEEFYLAGWSRNNGSENTAVITYNYADGSTSTETNLKVFKGGISLPTVDAYTEILNNDLSQGIPYWRAPEADKASEKKNGWGGYRIFIVSHRLTVDDTKTLKSIKIQPSNQDLNVLALTGKVSNSGIILSKLDETMAAFADGNTNDQIRNLVKEAEKYMEILDEKGVDYAKKAEYAATVQEYKEKYITVESIECYTDLENRNITVTFTGAIAEDSVSYQNFALKKDGVAVDNYKVEMISDKVVKITVKNTFDYECAYSLEISADVSNKSKTSTLGEAVVHEYDGLAAVDVKVTYENNIINLYLKNNLKEKLDSFVVMTGAFDENNSLVKFEPVSGALEAGEEFTNTIEFNTTAPKITCDVITSLDKAKLIFGQIDLK